MSDKLNVIKKQSLTEDVVEELYSIPVSKSCCYKAFVCGLLYNCKKNQEAKSYEAFFYRENDACSAADIIDGKFSSGERTEIAPRARGGHRGYAIEFKSKALISVFRDIDDGKKENIQSAVGFRCDDCKLHFFRGVFMSCAALSRPKSGYHLEFSLNNEKRAELLSKILSEGMAAPGRIVRANKIGLYYKSNGKISDLLYCFGALRASFDMTNVSIERDIRNNENRATNCVTRNISRSVGATIKQVEAIKYLFENDKIALLGDELEYTARLRIENDSASLSELAALHEPPISKSGLNSRLSKILAIAERHKNI